MSGSGESNPIAPHVRTLQIIVAALCSGLLMFLAIVLLMGLETTEPAPAANAAEGESGFALLTLVAAAFTLVAIAMSFIVPRVIVAQTLRRFAASEPAKSNSSGEGPSGAEAQALLGLHQTQTIIGAAMLEGAGMFVIIAYMLEGQPAVLLLLVLLLLGILARFPTLPRVVEWLVTKSRTIDELRALGNR